MFVTYGQNGSADLGYSWVYNQANIDQSKIVWAWDMGEVRNLELMDYFRGRRVWIVQLDRQLREAGPYLAPMPSGDESAKNVVLKARQ